MRERYENLKQSVSVPRIMLREIIAAIPAQKAGFKI